MRIKLKFKNYIIFYQHYCIVYPSIHSTYVVYTSIIIGL